MPDAIKYLYGRVYATLAAAQDALNTAAHLSGCSLAVHQKKPNAKEPRRVIFRCSKGRTYNGYNNDHIPLEKRRKRVSKMMGCPYRIVCKILPSGMWLVQGVTGDHAASHNHPMDILSTEEDAEASAAASQSIFALPRFAEGTNSKIALYKLTPLLTTSGGKWALSRDGEAVERDFKFNTFGRCWDFMTAVALHCKLHNHHPQWSNAYNSVFICWTTHDPHGLTEKDIDLAATCDALGKEFGELRPNPPGPPTASVGGPAAASASQAGAPVTNAPQTNASQANAPQANASQANAPQANASQANVSQVNASQANASVANASGADAGNLAAVAAAVSSDSDVDSDASGSSDDAR